MTGPIALPTTRGVKIDKPHLINWGGQLKASLGGPTQNLIRLGTRFALEITIPRMRAEPDGRIWAARLAQAQVWGALVRFGQDGLVIGSPGSPVVNGALQTGTTLNLGGFYEGYTVREGQFFSLVVAGRRYLHMATADVTAAGDGAIALPIFPMLRRSPGDGDTAEFAQPMLQGSLAGNDLAWTRPPERFFDFGTISVTEDE